MPRGGSTPRRPEARRRRGGGRGSAPPGLVALAAAAAVAAVAALPQDLRRVCWLQSRRGLLGQLLAAPAAAAAAAAACSAAALPPPAAAEVAAGQSAGAPATLASAAASGALQGIAQNVVKQSILHPFDTIKTRLQVSPPVPESELYSELYRGLLPPLLAGTPGSAAFFSAKEAASAALAVQGLPAPLPTLGGVTAGVLAAKAVRTPFDSAETRAMAGQRQEGDSALLSWDGSLAAIQKAVAEGGMGALYQGYWANVAYKIPADAVKFVAYEGLRGSGADKALPPGLAGAAATVVAQGLTTPLDVVRTRVLLGKPGDGSGLIATARGLLAEGDRAQIWAGLSWRLGRAVLAGAIQFTVLEAVKDALGGKR